MVCIPLGKVVSLTRVERSLRLEKRPGRRGLCLLQAFKRAGIPRAAQLRGRRADVPDLQFPIGLNFQVPIVLLVEQFLRITLILTEAPLCRARKPLHAIRALRCMVLTKGDASGVYGATVG